MGIVRYLHCRKHESLDGKVFHLHISERVSRSSKSKHTRDLRLSSSLSCCYAVYSSVTGEPRIEVGVD